MIHDLTLEQKIEVAAEQIENSLELGLSSEKRQIRLILTQFAQELVRGDNTGDSSLHLQRVIVAKHPLPRPLEAWNAANKMDCGDYIEWHLEQEKRGNAR